MAGAVVWLVIMIAIIVSSVRKNQKRMQQGHPLEHGNLPPNKDPYPEIIPSKPSAKPNRANTEKKREEAAMQRRMHQADTMSQANKDVKIEKALHQQKKDRYENSKPRRNGSLTSKAMMEYNNRMARSANDARRAASMNQGNEQGSILSRATQNVREDFQSDNEILETNSIFENAHASQAKTKIKVEQPQDKETLLKQVSDLMIMGPDTSIRFERDFIAEGVDMVNRGLGSV